MGKYRDGLNAEQTASLDKLEQLRDAEGYQGWVGRDGNKVADVDTWIEEHRR